MTCTELVRSRYRAVTAVSQFLASLLSPLCHFTAKFCMSISWGLHLGPWVSWWEGRLHSLKLNYMQKCVYMFPMCIFLKRVHSCHQISKEVYDPKRVKNHCPKLIKTSLGVSSGVLILAHGQSRISQPSFLQGAKTASRYWSLHAQQSAYHYSFFPHPFIHLICIHFHCPIHVPAPVKHTPGQDR